MNAVPQTSQHTVVKSGDLISYQLTNMSNVQQSVFTLIRSLDNGLNQGRLNWNRDLSNDHIHLFNMLIMKVKSWVWWVFGD